MAEQVRCDELEGLLSEAEAIRARLAETLQSAAARGIAPGAPSLSHAFFEFGDAKMMPSEQHWLDYQICIS
jgi:hypothetical protein